MLRTELINLELTKKLKSGSSEAFELLYKLYYKSLFNYALVYLRKPEIAEDIIQETFIRIWENRNSLDEHQVIKPFLFRCVHNNCINYIKKGKAHTTISAEYLEDLQSRLGFLEPDSSESYFEKLAHEELDVSINKAINALPQQCKEIFILSRFHDLTYKEIADKTGVSINTIKTQLSRALQKIRESVKSL